MKPKDITGQKFGRLTALRPTEKRLACNIVWEAQCECGNICEASLFQLTGGGKQSCGCLRIKDLRGQKFGRLTALNPTKKRKGGHVAWEVICECGTVCEVASGKLTTGHTRSCGCLQRDVVREREFIHGQSKTAGYMRAASNKRSAAKLNRTPVWANLDTIREFYMCCPDGYQVDHVIPLQGKLVSGLHVPENLQYLTKSENCKKNNKFTPQLETISED